MSRTSSHWYSDGSNRSEWNFFFECSNEEDLFSENDEISLRTDVAERTANIPLARRANKSDLRVKPCRRDGMTIIMARLLPCFSRDFRPNKFSSSSSSNDFSWPHWLDALSRSWKAKKHATIWWGKGNVSAGQCSHWFALFFSTVRFDTAEEKKPNSTFRSSRNF